MAAWASTNNSRGIGREGQVCVQMYGADREQPSRRDRLLMQLRIGRLDACDCTPERRADDAKPSAGEGALTRSDARIDTSPLSPYAAPSQDFCPMPRRRPRGRPLDGWLIIDKPPGLTSTDVVNRVRRAFDAQKAGHGGTLDPLATGVLPIAFGAATKTVPYVMDGTKLYRFTLRFGEARDTDDADGKLSATSPVRPTDEQIHAASGTFRGDIMQVPPTFSAVKVAGERAYDMAREGRPPNLEPRPARVDRFELIERPDGDTAIFEVASGKGVYMRSLARDLAQACGTLGHITALRRLRVGPFTEAQATPLDKLRATDDTPPASPDLLLPVATALADIPALALTEAEVSGLRHGQAISLVTLMGRIPGSADPAGGLVRAMAGGCVIGLARLEDGWMKPARML
jgi:tRNA pseudouridine55 synthase